MMANSIIIIIKVDNYRIDSNDCKQIAVKPIIRNKFLTENITKSSLKSKPTDHLLTNIS